MKIRKVKYAKPVPGKIERHCAAFLTQSDEVILIDSVFDKREGGIWPILVDVGDAVRIPIFNSGDAVRIVKDIMDGKKKSLRIAPVFGVVAWETIRYDEVLVAMANAGQLINAIVIENVPSSEEELRHFAGNALRESLLRE